MTKIMVNQLPSVKNEEQMRHLIRYVNFINSRPERKLKQKGFHTHHIYPKSMAKKNNIDDFNGNWNLIELTSREHFIAHMILWKCGYIEMGKAFWYMNHNKKYNEKITARQYEKLCKSQALTGDSYLKMKEKHQGKNHYRAKKVICIETGEIFSYVREVEKKYGYNHCNISMCCNHKKRRNTAHGYHWEFYDNYIKGETYDNN